MRISVSLHIFERLCMVVIVCRVSTRVQPRLDLLHSSICISHKDTRGEDAHTCLRLVCTNPSWAICSLFACGTQVLIRASNKTAKNYTTCKLSCELYRTSFLNISGIVQTQAQLLKSISGATYMA